MKRSVHVIASREARNGTLKRLPQALLEVGYIRFLRVIQVMVQKTCVEVNELLAPSTSA